MTAHRQMSASLSNRRLGRMSRCLLAGALLSTAPLAAAWHGLGPTGIDGAELTWAGDGRTVWALSVAAGVFRSVDAGATWSAASGGLPRGYATSLELRADPVDPGAAWLRRGGVAVLRTDDGGASWREVYRTASVLRFLGADPTGRGRAWVIDGWYNEAACARRTVDGGRTWQQLACLSVDGAEPIGVGADGSLWWWVRYGDYLLRLAPGGELAAVHPAGGRQGAAELFSLDPNAAETIWHTTFDDPPQLAVSRDGGANFVTVCEHACPARRVSVSPSRPQQLFSTAFAAGGTQVSRDGGRTWDPVPGLEQVLVRALAALPGASGVVLVLPYQFVGLPPAGVLRSADGARSWSESREGLLAWPAYLFGVDVRDDRRWFVAPSDEPGTLWVKRRSGPWGKSDDLARVGTTLVTNAGDPQLRFALTLRGLRRSDDGGAHWQKLPDPPRRRGWTALAADPRQPGGLWAVADREPVLWHSGDGGQRFSPELALPLLRIDAVAVDPHDARRLVVHGAVRRSGPCGTCTDPLSLETMLGSGVWQRNGALVYDRQVAGTSWRVADGGVLERRSAATGDFAPVALPAPNLRSRQVVAGRLATYVLAERTWRPGQPNERTQVVVWRTDDGGATWQRLSGELPQVLTIVDRLHVVGERDRLLLGTSGGLYVWSPG